MPTALLGTVQFCKNDVIFEVLMLVKIEVTVFWVVMLYSVIGYQ